MKRIVVLLLVLTLSGAAEQNVKESDGHCKYARSLEPRPHSVSITEFGAVGDGKTLNTVAFQNAIFYLKSFADKGGAQLYVPPGKWLTGSFNLTSHLTLFLERGAVILGSKDYLHWEVVEPLPSYGRGIDLPGGRYRALINGNNLNDVVITGDNGTIDGQGSVWWELFNSGDLKYSRPHLVEFTGSNDVTISNLTFLNSPAWNIHPVYCSNVQVQNITAYAPPESPFTCGVVPDSSEHVCIEKSNISMSYDAISLKSGWDEYGISYGKATTKVHIREVQLQSSSGSSLAFGSQMSGGISEILAENIHSRNSLIGINLKTNRGRGGYMKAIVVSDVEMENVQMALRVTGDFGLHPDDKFDPKALPVVNGITFKNMVGANIGVAGNFTGIDESPFTSICLSNITLSITSKSSAAWYCSNVIVSSKAVSPEPCSNLQASFSNSSSPCFSQLYFYPFAHAASS
ncbi:probable polygalacturonase [Mangifera indica]|uniref:probable polygalacturonase n=1 Tax=Mangifera indica TaxID=29780 RepID=UPI001CF9D724|nr:probable polygalacturonase [Mangifera indica]